MNTVLFQERDFTAPVARDFWLAVDKADDRGRLDPAKATVDDEVVLVDRLAGEDLDALHRQLPGVDRVVRRCLPRDEQREQRETQESQARAVSPKRPFVAEEA